MNSQIDILRSVRKSLLELVQNLSVQELNMIPPGFINNIAWNLGHMVAAQQGVCYKRAGLPSKVSESFFEKYKPGSGPSGFIDENELTEIKELLLSTLDEFDEDLSSQDFTRYPSWTTRYGATLSSIQDVLNFMPFHDGLHMGYIMALKRAVIQSQKQPADHIQAS